MSRCWIVDASGAVHPAEPKDAVAAAARGERAWIDLEGEHETERTVSELLAPLAIHPLVIDDMVAEVNRPKVDLYDGPRKAFGRLAHDNSAPYGGLFSQAAKIYKRVMSPEGHRHYPLRSIKSLRQTPDLLLPLGPFFDDWGRLLGRHPLLSDSNRAEILSQLFFVSGTDDYGRNRRTAEQPVDGNLRNRLTRLHCDLVDGFDDAIDMFQRHRRPVVVGHRLQRIRPLAWRALGDEYHGGNRQHH